LEKVAKTVAKQKNDNISTSKLNLKVKDIYINPFLNHWNIPATNHASKLLI